MAIFKCNERFSFFFFLLLTKCLIGEKIGISLEKEDQI